MGWNKKSNVAQYGQGNWSNYVQKTQTHTAEEAMRIAFANPEITFFFFCRETIILDHEPAAQYGPFNAGDAVFFKGEPLYGSAPQCDSYEKTGISTIYINPHNIQQFQNISSYVLANGTPAIDVVCIFAANYATNTIPMLRANNDPQSKYQFNPNIRKVLSSGLVKALQSKGITVLLTILNAHTQTGWSQFTDQKTAQEFVNYLTSEVVTLYGLDGIDIDDEYSDGLVIYSSLAMVTTLMKKTMPGKLITKALFRDEYAFKANWNGNTLGANLDYGWEMSYYGGDASARLSAYNSYGMKKNQLCLGFSAERRFSSSWNQVGPQAHKTIHEGYAGGMMFAYENQPDSIGLMKAMVNGMDGPGSWNKIVPKNLSEDEGKARSRGCCSIL